MSKKILKPLLIGAAIIAIGVATGGIGFAPATTIGGGLAGLSATALPAALLTTGFGGTLLAAGIGIAASGIASSLTKTPHATLSQIERLNASINPSASRKFVFGRTAMATDIRYVEPSGTNQEYIDHIICVAAHRVNSIEELWIDDLQAWSSSAGVMGKFVGYLTVNVRLEGTAANTIAINGGAKWGAGCRLTGCAYMHVRIKRTGNGKKAESPFVSGLSSRLTIVGEGVPVYDPRLDSTIPGGSGPQRYDDQSTWSFDASGLQQGRNLALQMLAYQLGWRINGRISVGCGSLPARLNIASYIAAANLCDETILLANGSTQKRYVGGGVFGDDADGASTLSAFANASNSALQDAGGKLRMLVRHNDLGAPAVDLTDDDVLSPGTWEPVPEINQAYNVVKGRYTNPSSNSLYQLVDYPEVRLASVDGQDRLLPLDLPLIDDAARAQRIAKQVLQRLQYQGKFTANFGARAWNAKVGDIVRVTLSASGWVNKLFRVEGQGISMTGSCPMVLREEHPSIYAWDAEDRAAVTAAAPTVYDPLNSPLILGISEAGTTANWTGVLDDDPDNRPRPEDGATVGAPSGTDVAGMPASELVISLNDVINASLDQAAAIMASQQLAEFRSVETDILTHYDGLKAEVVVKQAIQQHTDDTSALYLIVNTIGAMTPDGSAFVIDGSKVYVDTDHSMAAKFGEITANFGAADGKMTALVTNFANVYSSNSVTRAQAISNLQALFGPTAAAAVVTVQTAQAAINSSTASSITTLNTRTNNHAASITTFNEVLINPDGSAAAKAILAINVDGKVGGMYGTVTKTVANMRQVWDAFSLEQPDGTLLLYAAGGVVKMPAVVVNTLEANTVTTDNIIANNVSALVSGLLASPLTGTTASDWQSVIGVPFTLARTADLLVIVGGRHVYTDQLHVLWSMRCRLDSGGAIGVGAGGEGAATDCPALMVSIHNVPAGLHTIYIDWFADDHDLSLTACEAAVFYRYK